MQIDVAVLQSLMLQAAALLDASAHVAAAPPGSEITCELCRCDWQ